MRRSWPIDSFAGKYVAVRSKDLLSDEKPIQPAAAWRILERFTQRPQVLSQLTGLSQAVNAGVRGSSSISLRALEKAFSSGEFALLTRGSQLSKIVPDTPAENIAEQVRKAEVVKTWVEFEVVDAEGNPCADRRFTCMIPDGTLQEGWLNSRGKVRFDGIDPGNCVFALADLDHDAWERIS